MDDLSGAILQLERRLMLRIGHTIVNILTAINDLMTFDKKWRAPQDVS
jgi:hypothetical protein